jgi:hypothetical protein
MELRKPLKHKNMLMLLYGLLILVLIYISKHQNIGINENDWVIALSNVLFFMVVQMFFFIFIASKQYEEVIISKLDIIKKYGEKNMPFKFLLHSYKNNYLENNEDEINKETNERKDNNMNLTYDYCGLPIIIVSTIIVLLVVLTKTNLIEKLKISNVKVKDMTKKTVWNQYDTFGLLLVLLAYSTEILFFYFVVKKYEFVNDNTIYNTLFKNVFL